jgi:photoactive yellow protein
LIGDQPQTTITIMKVEFVWDDPEALTTAAVAEMSPEDWNEVAFGVIELDLDMIVRTYNRAESSLAQRDPANTIGRHFFTEVAPCTDGPGFRGRLEALRHGGESRFDFEFAFPWGAKRVRVRALRLRESLWLMVTPIQVRPSRAAESSKTGAST